MNSDSTKRHKRPNIIWYFSDQHRAQATSLAGDPNVNTPNIDRLAQQGVWFQQAMSGCPWCTPFRGSLLTGRYPNNAVYRTPDRLDPNIPTIAQAFNDGGYDTAYFGKWHLDRPHGQAPPMVNGEPRHSAHHIATERRGGFKTWLGYESSAKPYDVWLHGHTADGNEVEMHPLGKYETEGLTDHLVDYLQSKGNGGDEDEPFFAVCSVQPPHDPYNPPEEWLARKDPAKLQLRPNVPDIADVQKHCRESLAGYYASIECIDHHLGRVMQTLIDTGLHENTYLFYFSDHGDMHRSHGLVGKSVPWEESIRIPLIIAGGPAQHAAGRISRGLLSSVDIAPTTLALASLPPREPMPGFDYSPYVTEQHAPDMLPNEPDSALGQHLVSKRHSNGMDCTWRSVVTHDGWKYACTEHAPIGMFNLNEDPYELHNRAWDHSLRDKRAVLLDRLQQWLDEVGDTYPLPTLPALDA